MENRSIECLLKAMFWRVVADACTYLAATSPRSAAALSSTRQLAAAGAAAAAAGAAAVAAVEATAVEYSPVPVAGSLRQVQGRIVENVFSLLLLGVCGEFVLPVPAMPDSEHKLAQGRIV